jgi:UDP-N-acetylglucosamine 2-epimerase
MKLCTIAGTRPEIIKLSILVPLLDKKYDHLFVYTGQHYSPVMRDVFFDELGVRQPDHNLDVHSSDCSKIEEELYTCLERENPSCALVYGDTNSTAAGARAVKRVKSKLIHLEAGLRSFDLRMPEEWNRKFVDKVSDHLLTPTTLTKTFLEYEGYRNIHIVGNPVVDACEAYLPRALKRKTKDNLELDDEFLLITAHRQENVDNPYALKELVRHLSGLEGQCVYPIHPRTERRLKEYGITMPRNVKTVEPLGYFDFLNLLYHCSAVLTDSGGVQEEAMTLKKPCITLRENTERWETVLMGANRLFPLLNNQESLSNVVEEMRSRCGQIRSLKNPYGEGNTCQKVVEVIEKITGEEKR